MKKSYFVFVFLVFPLFLIAGHPAFPETKGCPVWIDFNRLLSEADEACATLPVKCGQDSFLVTYCKNGASNRIERVELVDEKTKKIK